MALPDPRSVRAGDYYWTIWGPQGPGVALLHVLAVEEHYVAYEYLVGYRTYLTADHASVFVLYVDREATEEDWLCALLSR